MVKLLNSRDAFYGGWTNATKLLYNFKENSGATLTFAVSIQPFITDYQKYPKGHQKKILNLKKYKKSWYGLM